MSYKIISVVGARPNFVKAATLSRAFLAHPDFAETIIHTGQHFDAQMSDVFFEELSIPKPKYNLNINSAGHGEMTGKMLTGIEEILLQEKPDAVLVYGDTNSTLAGALAASKLHIPVIHVEAGLRSFNRSMPEEINRVVTDHISDVLLCPTGEAVKNLERENITNNVVHCGDVMFDATLHAIEMVKQRSRTIHDLDLGDKKFALLTMHRAENVDDAERLSQLLTYVRQQAEESGLQIVFPVHPRTAKTVAQFSAITSSWLQCKPLGYLAMHSLLQHVQAVFTDSGGLQKEAYFHKVPCVTLRDETEWIETINSGWNRLWTQPDKNKQPEDIKDYGDGKAAQKSVIAIEQFMKVA